MEKRSSPIVSLLIILSVFIFHGNISALNDYEKINIVGETSAGGVYDPSVEYDDNGTGWLAYTAMSDNTNTQLLETHLAKSTDRGKTWTKAGKANSAFKETLDINGIPTEVAFRQETASLLFDPFDPDANKRWKLFTARGYTKTGAGYHDTDWGAVHIAYKYASSPENLLLAEEIPLFGSSHCKPPACSMKYDLNSFHPGLRNVVFYEEPGTLIKDGVIYLTLSAVTYKGQNTILLSSKDHGETWKYIGTLTSRKDAKSLGYDELTSSGLAEEGGRVFLLVSPVRKVIFPRHLQYEGVYIFEFRDISKALLKRDRRGTLIVQKYIPPVFRRSIGGGQSEYHAQNAYGGIVMAQSDAQAPLERFKIFNTGEKIAD